MKYIDWDEKVRILRRYYSFDVKHRNGKIYHGGLIIMVDTLYDELKTAMEHTVEHGAPSKLRRLL